MALTKVSNSMLVQPVNPNILINPSFTVTQRGTVVEHPAISFGPDRWIFSGVGQSGGTKVESSTEVDAATGINKLVVNHEGTTSGETWVRQYVEAVNIQGLYGKEMTFSFSYSDVGGSGIPKVQIASWDSSATSKDLYNAVPKSLGNNRWACTFTLSTADGAIPDPSEHGMQVAIFPNEKNNAPNEWFVWETKLEVGSVVTPFIARSHGEELSLCQRYYFVNDPDGLGTYMAGGAYTRFQTTAIHVINFPTTMRASPTIGSYTLSVVDTVDTITGVGFCRFSGSAKSEDTIAKITSSVAFDAEL